ncbi:MAG: PEGA domain-containing protein [Myxococcales bacterium]|nr:PEGA domain-containing protein [Myxococcales bacterium]
MLVRRPPSLVVSFVAAALASRLAHGQSAPEAPSASPIVAPEELVRRGVAERSAGRDEAALALFQQAWEQGHSPVALAQIAVTEQSLGRWLLAERHLREALASAEHPYIQRNRAALEEAYATIRRRVGTLVVVSNVPSATVWIDGEPVASASASERAEPLRLLVGSHRLEVRAEGYFTVSRPIEITPDVPAREEATLRAEERGPRSDAVVLPARSPDPQPRAQALVAPREALARGPRPASWALWGGALAAVVIGAAGHGARESLAVRYNNECFGPNDPSGACSSLRGDGGVMLGVAIGGYLVGAGLAIAGTIDALVPRRSTTVSVGASASGGVVALGGRF